MTNTTSSVAAAVSPINGEAVVKFAKGEVAADLKRDTVYADYVAANGVTTDTVAAHALALTNLAYPGVKPQSRAEASSREGRAHSFRTKVRAGLKRAVGSDDDTAKPVTLRVSLSGEGGGTTVIPADHPQYALVLALVTGEAALAG